MADVLLSTPHAFATAWLMLMFNGVPAATLYLAVWRKRAGRRPIPLMQRLAMFVGAMTAVNAVMAWHDGMIQVAVIYTAGSLIYVALWWVSSGDWRRKMRGKLTAKVAALGSRLVAVPA